MEFAQKRRRVGRGAKTLTMAVIDASVYVALINANEPHHAASWRWRLADRNEETLFDIIDRR